MSNLAVSHDTPTPLDRCRGLAASPRFRRPSELLSALGFYEAVDRLTGSDTFCHDCSPRTLEGTEGRARALRAASPARRAAPRTMRRRTWCWQPAFLYFASLVRVAFPFLSSPFLPRLSLERKFPSSPLFTSRSCLSPPRLCFHVLLPREEPQPY